MKSTNTIVLSMLLLALPMFVEAMPPVVEEIIVEAMEIDKLDIMLSDKLSGYVLHGNKKCRITSDTKAFKAFKSVPLIQAKNQRGKPALVHCDVKAQQVTKISWK